MDDIRPTIRDFIADELANGSKDGLANDTQLLEKEIMDSTGILMVIGFLEDEFDIFIDADDVSVDHFRTIDAIAELVADKQQDGT